MSLQFEPIISAFGAEVIGFTADKIDDPASREALQEAFRKYRLLVYRNLDINATDQVRLSEVFGKIAPRPPVFEHIHSEEPNTQYVSNTRKDGMLPDGELTYHQDHLFDPVPLRSVMLYALEAPNEGGETKFRSLDETYRRLDEDTRARAEATRCLHIWDWVKGPLPGPSIEKRQYYSLETNTPGQPQTWHPLVFRDSDGGDPAVWALYGDTAAFEGATMEEGQQLLSDILDVAAETEQYAHKWRVGDLVMWDNLHLQHAREPFDPSEKRTLRRATIV